MHIVINGWFWDQTHAGSGQYLRQLVEHLPRAAPELRLTLVVPRATSDQQAAASKLRQLRLYPAPSSRSNLGKVWFEQVTFPRLCRQLQADVAHVPYWGSPLSPNLPTVVSVLDLIPMLLAEYRGGPLVRLYTGLVAAAAQNAAQVLTISEASKRDIVSHLRIPAGRVHVTHLAAGRRFTPQPDPAGDSALRQRHPGLPRKYVLYLGGVDARKNVETLVQMCTWLQRAFGTEFPLVLAGGLPEQHDRFFRDPRALARSFEVEELVCCIGPVAEEDKPALYRGASAFLFPSRYEGFGLPVLEALACGSPVVGSDASSIPEIVGDAGILVDPDDAERMAGGLIAVLNDGELHRELSQRAVAQAARFSWERCARQTAEVYRLAQN
ncbi:MAG: glycosyltransferase family 4 protein [Thermoflexales bacterium]|nr:glycosyltransferase family 4 protein [Thermoflexales bacterium]